MARWVRSRPAAVAVGSGVDVQGEVEPAGPGQQRFQPCGADFGWVAGHGEGGRVAVTDAQIPRGELDRGRCDRTRDVSGGDLGLVRRGAVRVAGHGQSHRRLLFVWLFAVEVMTASGGARPAARGGRYGSAQDGEDSGGGRAVEGFVR